MMPIFLDGFTQLMGTRESKNGFRLSKGLIASLGFAILLKAFKCMIVSNII